MYLVDRESSCEDTCPGDLDTRPGDLQVTLSQSRDGDDVSDDVVPTLRTLPLL